MFRTGDRRKKGERAWGLANHHTKQFIATAENKYDVKIKKWMSDAGGEYKSTAFIKMLKDKGIEILQSVPHAHQQNGRAERIIRTLMEKAQAMRLQACLPQSWWEFALDHATHVYNRTPIRCLAWKTPYEILNNEKPTVDHLRVLGSGAYVFLPTEIRTDKLAPRSELMTYLGNVPGVKGWIFMRSPNNILFTAAQATFNETFFPRCPKAVRRPTTRLQTPAPPPVQCSKDETCHCLSVRLILFFFPSLTSRVALLFLVTLHEMQCPTLHPPLHFTPHDPHDPNNSYDLGLTINQSPRVYRDTLDNSCSSVNIFFPVTNIATIP